MSVPERFVSGESSALVNAINGRAALPSGGAARASDAGVRGQPTLLSNAETFAQLAVLAMLGPDGYASVGAPAEPGTVLLTVGGSVAHPAVVETPTDVPLGHILDICGAGPASGVLVGGYHGRWLPAAAAYDLPVSRAALAAGGGTLGAGIVLVLGADTCPLAEVSRVAGYLAMQSSGQCGPCKQGLPAVASSLAALAAGSGGMDDLESVRRAAAGGPRAGRLPPSGRHRELRLLRAGRLHCRHHRAPVPRELRPAGRGRAAAGRRQREQADGGLDPVPGPRPVRSPCTRADRGRPAWISGVPGRPGAVLAQQGRPPGRRHVPGAGAQPDRTRGRGIPSAAARGTEGGRAVRRAPGSPGHQSRRARPHRRQRRPRLAAPRTAAPRTAAPRRTRPRAARPCPIAPHPAATRRAASRPRRSLVRLTTSRRR